MDGVVIGKVISTFGLEGEIKVLPYLPPKKWRAIARVYFKRKTTGEMVGFEVVRIKQAGKGIALKLKDVQRAQEFVGAKVFAMPQELPKERGEYFAFELEGLEVLTESGKSLGKVNAVVDGRAYSFLEVGEMLIPFTERFVLDVDLTSGKIIVSKDLEEIA
ncbi:MAG: ribosome maturation factor RimM [Aquificaceae bacterium]|nr:ribosome maturation factor RimM [Aquificaceae bacterium]MDW8237372.1 ribosome maturation factor RimM [Aquificaceae bacterium]